MNKELLFVNDDRVTQVQKVKWKLYYHIRNTVYFNRKYGKNYGVRVLRSLGVLLQYQGYVLNNILFNKKYDLTDLKVFNKAYRDGIMGNLGKNYHSPLPS